VAAVLAAHTASGNFFSALEALPRLERAQRTQRETPLSTVEILLYNAEFQESA
jgi:hypothetical protein